MKQIRARCYWISLVGFVLIASCVQAEIAIDPNSPSTLYLSRAQGYFLRSDDSGLTWSVKSTGLPLRDVTSILAIGSPTILYVSTAEGVYRSRNRGETWSVANAGLEGLMVAAVTGSPAQAFIFAATNAGVYRSSDEGQSWNAAGTLPDPPDIVTPDLRSPTIVYAGASNSLYRSFDSGSTWTKTGAVFPIETSAGIEAIAVDPNDPSTLLITESSTLLNTARKIFATSYFLFITRDRGNSVTRVLSPFTDQSGDYVGPVAFDSAGYAYLSGNGKIAVSADHGLSWRVSQNNGGGRIATSPNSPRVFVEGAPPSLSDDHGSTWTTLSIPTCLGLRDILCLADGRFLVRLQAFVGGTLTTAHAVPLTKDAGAFWFFSENNIEVVVKVVDGRAFNGHFWVFVASLTDVFFELRVDDVVKSNSWISIGQNGQMQSFADLHTFGDSP